MLFFNGYPLSVCVWHTKCFVLESLSYMWLTLWKCCCFKITPNLVKQFETAFYCMCLTLWNCCSLVRILATELIGYIWKKIMCLRAHFLGKNIFDKGKIMPEKQMVHVPNRVCTITHKCNWFVDYFILECCHIFRFKLLVEALVQNINRSHQW